MCRAEAFLKLHQIDDAESILLSIPKSELQINSSSQARFFGMLCEAYSYFVRAQIEMAFVVVVLGRDMKFGLFLKLIAVAGDTIS